MKRSRHLVVVLAALGLLTSCSPNQLDRASAAATTATSATISVSDSTTGSPVGPSTDAGTTSSVPRTVLGRTLGAGMVGDDVSAVQRRLNDLKFDVGVADGVYGPVTIQAIWAYQQLVMGWRGRDVTGQVTPALWDRIQEPLGIRDWRPRATGRHVVIFLQAQAAVVFVNNEIRLVSHISSGDGEEWCSEVKVVYPPGVSTTTLPEGQKPRRKCGKSLTPGGTFKIYRRDYGWSEIPLGKVYNPLYFNAGIALHGAEEVPLFPASHGCVRFPMHIAEYLPDLLRNGDDVFVFDGVREPEFYGPQKPPFDWDDPTDTTIPTTTVPKTTTTTTLVKPTTSIPGATAAGTTTTTPVTTTPATTTTRPATSST